MDVEIRAFQLNERIKKAIAAPSALLLPREVRDLIGEIGAVLADVAREVVDLREREAPARPGHELCE